MPSIDEGCVPVWVSRKNVGEGKKTHSTEIKKSLKCPKDSSIVQALMELGSKVAILQRVSSRKTPE